MRASFPHDVDLEDQLIYGLTPIRFGYLVVAILGGMSIWGVHQVPLPARLLTCFLLALAAILLAWGRWRGRPLDRLLLDVTMFLRRNYRFQPRSGWSGGAAAQTVTVSFASINAVGRRRHA